MALVVLVMSFLTNGFRRLVPTRISSYRRVGIAPILQSRTYHEKVIEHYERPRNVGSLPKSDPNVGTGLVGAPACGDVMKLQIRVTPDGIIEEVRFKTFGCGSAIASSSLATEWVKGKHISDAVQIKNTDIAKELCLPPVKYHCSMLAEDAIKSAVHDLQQKWQKVSDMSESPPVAVNWMQPSKPGPAADTINMVDLLPELPTTPPTRSLFTTTVLWNEAKILCRIVYKNKNQQRNSIPFRKLNLAQKDLRNIAKIELWLNAQTDMTSAVFLGYLATLRKLIKKTKEDFTQLFIHMKHLLDQALFMPYALSVVAIAGRISYLLTSLDEEVAALVPTASKPQAARSPKVPQQSHDQDDIGELVQSTKPSISQPLNRSKRKADISDRLDKTTNDNVDWAIALSKNKKRRRT